MTYLKQKDGIKISALLWILMVCFVKDPAYAQSTGNDEPGPIVSRIIVDVQGMKGDVSPWVDLAKNLIFIREGEPFSIKRFRDSLDALKSSNMFKAIHVSESDRGEKQFTLGFTSLTRPLLLLSRFVFLFCQAP